MLSRLGVNQNIKWGWRHVCQLFGGIGIRRLLPEISIARTNMFLQHYRSPAAVVNNLIASMDHLQLEAGFDNCPLYWSYHPLGPLTTKCWV